MTVQQQSGYCISLPTELSNYDTQEVLMSVLTLIDRTVLGESRDISIEQFIAATIDYRNVRIWDADKEVWIIGQAAWMIQLGFDYEAVGWHSMHTGQRIQVDAAYWDYLELIRSDYRELR